MAGVCWSPSFWGAGAVAVNRGLAVGICLDEIKFRESVSGAWILITVRHVGCAMIPAE